MVLKSGSKVKLDVDGLKDPAERAKAFSALQAQLEKNGCMVDPNGTISLVASAEPFDEIDLRYRLLDTPGKKDKDAPIKTYKFQVHFARIKFVQQGATVWESAALNLPGDITLLEGETVERRLKTHEQPKYEFYQTVVLPRLLVRSKGTGILGTSTVTVSGVR